MTKNKKKKMKKKRKKHMKMLEMEMESLEAIEAREQAQMRLVDAVADHMERLGPLNDQASLSLQADDLDDVDDDDDEEEEAPRNGSSDSPPLLAAAAAAASRVNGTGSKGECRGIRTDDPPRAEVRREYH